MRNQCVVANVTKFDFYSLQIENHKNVTISY